MLIVEQSIELLHEMRSSCMSKGKVYLVGAGPGDPGLITVKGLEAIRRADVILYDRLIAKELLAHARPDAEMVYVGKEPGRHTCTQEEIVRLMLDEARRGKTVVRLHGGDPFLFGRGFEEYRALRREGIPCEVIPGVPSATAVPEHYGIPLVLRGVASSVAIVTGTEDPAKGRRFVNFKKLATAVDTIVILMGAAKLPEIAQELIQGGLDPDTPVAILRAYIEPEIRQVTRLRDCVSLKIQPPVVIVIGRTVNVQE